MKRKRKAQLVGFSIRKFVGQKRSAIIKGARKNLSPENRRLDVGRVMDGLAAYVADVASDRPTYLARFFATWQAAVNDIQGSAEKMLAERSFVSVDPDHGLNPYSIFFLSVFARLMDNLTYDEEAALRDVFVRMDGAWGMYFSVIRMRWPKLSGLVDRAEEIREALQLEVRRLFFGEVVPALTVRWSVAYSGLEKALELIGKESKNDFA